MSRDGERCLLIEVVRDLENSRVSESFQNGGRAVFIKNKKNSPRYRWTRRSRERPANARAKNEARPGDGRIILLCRQPSRNVYGRHVCQRIITIIKYPPSRYEYQGDVLLYSFTATIIILITARRTGNELKVRARGTHNTTSSPTRKNALSARTNTPHPTSP